MTPLRDSIIHGKPVEQLFIDVHGHFGPWSDTTIPYCLDHDRLIAEMDRYGCDQAWMCASNPGFGGDLAAKNDLVFDLAQRFPHRILPYCTLSAHRPQQALPELKRCLDRGPCIGIKMHRYRQPPYTCRSHFLQPVLELLNDRRLVYLNHAFPDYPALEWAAAAYPQMTFLSGHADLSINQLACRIPNIRDCSCAASRPDLLEQIVQTVGRSDTLLIGSDFGLFQLAFGIGMLAYSRLPETDVANILGLNALALLRRVAWFQDLQFSKPLPPAPLPPH